MIKLSALIFCATLFACALAILAQLFVARRMGLIDKPGGHKRHQEAVPLLVGFAIFLNILCAAAFGLQVDLPLLFSPGALLLVSIYDDLFDTARIRNLLPQIGIKLTWKKA